MQHSSLLKPIRIGGIVVKNRIAMAPINNSTQMNPSDGAITQTCVDYYVERAKGGTGLIITGVFKVENEIEKCVNIKDGIFKWPLLTRKASVQYAELAAGVHAYGGRIFMQISAGPGRVTFPDVVLSGVTPVSASANQCFFVPSATCRPLETAEVAQIVRAFGEAAKIAAVAGIDGVEVHGHEGYLIDQFTTAMWNRRTDKYGGDLEGRLTFPIEILRSIKGSVGADFPVTYRMGVKHFVRGPWKSALRTGDVELGRDIEESVEMAKLLERAGYDGLSIDTGCYESSYWAHPPYYHPRGFAVDLTAQIKHAVSIPVMVAGRLGRPDVAEKVIADGKADIVVIGRDLLADPEWALKASKGTAEDIRPCVGCHDGCIQRTMLTGSTLTCSVNPACGRETTNPVQPAMRRKRVVIAGGGVAGMECARVASLRGHDVVLYEKNSDLGGHLTEASVPSFKDDLKRLLAWYKRQLDVQKVRVELGTEVNAAVIRDLAPDAVVVATGSSPCIPQIPGADSESVATCCELLLGKKKTGERTIVVGGGLEGSETALWLAQQGKKVTIVEMLPEVGTGVVGANRAMLLDLLSDLRVDAVTNARLHEITSEGIVVLTKDMHVRQLECDTVALAIGMAPNRKLYDSLAGEIGEVYDIGDCKKPRKIHDAVWEGWTVGRSI